MIYWFILISFYNVEVLFHTSNFWEFWRISLNYQVLRVKTKMYCLLQGYTKASPSSSYPSVLSFTAADVHDGGRIGGQWGTGINSVPSCCGSVVPYAHTRQSPPFTREVTGPTVDVPNVPPNGRDSIPPSRWVSFIIK